MSEHVSCSPELQFLVLTSCMTMSKEQKKQALKFYHFGLSEKILQRETGQSHVWGTVNHNLQKLQIEGDPIFSPIVRGADFSAQRSIQLCITLVDVFSLFDEKNVDMVLLKGPVLAQMLYGDTALRFSSDLDILVREDQFEQAVELLEKAGFVNQDGITTPKRKKYYFHQRWAHHYSMVRKGVMVELHWRTDSYLGTTFEEFYQTEEIYPIFGIPMSAPERIANMHFLIHHGAHHGYVCLRWLMDIYELLQREDCPDLNLLYQRFEKSHTAFVYLQTLMLLNEFKLISISLEEGEKMHLETRRDTDGKLEEIRIRTHRDSKEVKSAQKLCQACWRVLCTLDTEEKKSRLEEYNSVYGKEMEKRGILEYHPMLQAFKPKDVDFRTMNLPDVFFFLYYPLHLLFWFWRRLPFYKGKERTVKLKDLLRRR